MDQYRAVSAVNRVDVVARLEQQELRLRALEAENRDLRHQLDALRRGVGIALVVDGRTLPLVPQPIAGERALPTPVALESSFGVENAHQPLGGTGAQSAAPRSNWPPAQSPSPYRHPRPAAVHTSTGPVNAQPVPQVRVGSHQENLAQPGPRPATTPAPPFERLPVVRPLSTPLVTQTHAAWLQSETAWPDPPPLRPVPLDTPTAMGGQHQPTAPPLPHPHPRGERTPSAAERNIFADSFIL